MDPSGSSKRHGHFGDWISVDATRRIGDAAETY
jgi:hypothetical protein